MVIEIADYKELTRIWRAKARLLDGLYATYQFPPVIYREYAELNLQERRLEDKLREQRD